MFISIDRGKDAEFEEWLDKASSRFSNWYTRIEGLDPRSYEARDLARDRYNDLELSYVQNKRDEYRSLIDKLVHKDWLELDRISSVSTRYKRFNEVSWLITQDSWCIIELPGIDVFCMLTRDPRTAFIYKFIRKESISQYDLNTAIETYGLYSFKRDTSKINIFEDINSDWPRKQIIEDWLNRECKAPFYKLPTNITFTDRDDALRFRLSGIEGTEQYVCGRTL